jgi:hypothetical protein
MLETTLRLTLERKHLIEYAKQENSFHADENIRRIISRKLEQD